MSRLVTIACLTIVLALSPGRAQAQKGDGDLRKEIELLKRELDLLKRENALLKSENAALKKGSTAGGAKSEAEGETKVTVDGVDYVYQGSTRSGSTMYVTIVATSRRGDRVGPNGAIVIIDDEGEKYRGIPTTGFGARPTLREGIPVKLTWKFGVGGLGGQSALPPTKLKEYPIVMIHQTVANAGDTIDFRNVPAVVSKSKAK